MLRGPTCLQLLIIFSFLTALMFLCLLVYEFLVIQAGIFSKSPSTKMLQAMEQHFPYSYWEEMSVSLERTIELVPGLRQAVPNCSQFNRRKQFSLFQAAKQWTFDSDTLKQLIFHNLTDRSLKCTALKEKLTFLDKPLSQEEDEYPLGYGMLVYDNAIQKSKEVADGSYQKLLLLPPSHLPDALIRAVPNILPLKGLRIYLLLSAIYQPQNAYCIAVDAKSSEQFKADMDLLADCFPNIFVMQINKVEWYTYSVVRGVWKCLRYLSQLDHPWKYYQYLSGVDLPLKTNLEMVRIFKQLNGTTNTDIRAMPMDRIQRVLNKTSPLKLYKSSLSALLSRESIDGMMKSQRVRDFLIFSQQLDCPDEALWATILGNPEQLVLPGSFIGSAVYNRTIEERKRLPKYCGYREKTRWIKNLTVEEPFSLHSYYISRYQVWVFTPNTRCHGKYTHFSCVYGILDLSALLSRPELIAHKFYLSVEPACYFCVYQKIRQRALDKESQRRFKGHVYFQLPQVKMSRGLEANHLKFYFNNCLMDD